MKVVKVMSPKEQEEENKLNRFSKKLEELVNLLKNSSKEEIENLTNYLETVNETHDLIEMRNSLKQVVDEIDATEKKNKK